MRQRVVVDGEWIYFKMVVRGYAKDAGKVKRLGEGKIRACEMWNEEIKELIQKKSEATTRRNA